MEVPLRLCNDFDSKVIYILFAALKTPTTSRNKAFDWVMHAAKSNL